MINNLKDEVNKRDSIISTKNDEINRLVLNDEELKLERISLQQ